MRRMIMRKRLSLMRGLTLLETMFAIAIGALVLIGAVIFYMSTKQNANVGKSVSDMNAIVSAIENYTAAGNPLSGVGQDLTALQGGGYLPDPLNDAWGQEYKIATAISPASVTITIPGIAGTGDNNCKAISTSVKSNSSTVTDQSTATVCKFEFLL